MGLQDGLIFRIFGPFWIPAGTRKTCFRAVCAIQEHLNPNLRKTLSIDFCTSCYNSKAHNKSNIKGHRAALAPNGLPLSCCNQIKLQGISPEAAPKREMPPLPILLSSSSLVSSRCPENQTLNLAFSPKPTSHPTGFVGVLRSDCDGPAVLSQSKGSGVQGAGTHAQFRGSWGKDGKQIRRSVAGRCIILPQRSAVATLEKHPLVDTQNLHCWHAFCWLDHLGCYGHRGPRMTIRSRTPSHGHPHAGAAPGPQDREHIHHGQQGCQVGYLPCSQSALLLWGRVLYYGLGMWKAREEDLVEGSLWVCPCLLKGLLGPGSGLYPPRLALSLHPRLSSPQPLCLSVPSAAPQAHAACMPVYLHAPYGLYVPTLATLQPTPVCALGDFGISRVLKNTYEMATTVCNACQPADICVAPSWGTCPVCPVRVPLWCVWWPPKCLSLRR